MNETRRKRHRNEDREDGGTFTKVARTAVTQMAPVHAQMMPTSSSDRDDLMAAVASMATRDAQHRSAPAASAFKPTEEVSRAQTVQRTTLQEEMANGQGSIVSPPVAPVVLTASASIIKVSGAMALVEKRNIDGTIDRTEKTRVAPGGAMKATVAVAAEAEAVVEGGGAAAREGQGATGGFATMAVSVRIGWEKISGASC